ncbi:unnamed protein product [Strongylus vulgaris]|uniref:Urocanase Rossmann-like domain-containing protein n=1 Tax=Strongylus vulgaris TaxID=40348 RepID=A0A3P7JJ61_STRVU|nr:unnamed protein product [Strongylus vulgaris]
MKRHKQGWLDEYSSDLNEIIEMIRKYRKEKETKSIGYLGNVVDLWERLAAEPDQLVDLGSDQTSLHNPFLGGYYPVGLTVEEANVMMTAEPERFKKLVQESLLRQIAAIDKLAARGMHFWDYGNAFLLECQRAGANMRHPKAKDDKTFRYPSYMQDIMGLLRQIAAIDKLAARGMHFWDYGNAFLLECQRAGANMRHPKAKDDKTFRYPSYMQDIMGYV